MVVQMRQFDKVKEKVEIRLDNRQIGWLVVGCLVISVAVFAAGFHMGSTTRPDTPTDPSGPLLAEVAPKTTADLPMAQTQRDATASKPGGAAQTTPADKVRYTYDRVLTAPTPPASVDDPALKALAKAEQRMEADKAEAATELDNDAEAEPANPKKAASPREMVAAADENAIAFADAADPNAEKPLEAEEMMEPVDLAQANAPVKAPSPAKAPEKGEIEPSAQAPVTPEAKVTGYTIQVKAFRKRQEARQFIAALRDAGYKPYLAQADLPGKGRFYRVRLGKFADLPEATARQEAFEKAEGFSTIVTPI